MRIATSRFSSFHSLVVFRFCDDSKSRSVFGKTHLVAKVRSVKTHLGKTTTKGDVFNLPSS